jgi:hypothetical protein
LWFKPTLKILGNIRQNPKLLAWLFPPIPYIPPCSSHPTSTV